MKIKLLLTGLLLALATSLAFAAGSDGVIAVVKGANLSIRLPVLEGSSGKEATLILTSDLERSGCFQVVGQGGDYFVEGSANGGTVKYRVMDGKGQAAVNATAEGNLRRAAHKVADEIISKLTGQPGIAQSRIAFISDKNGKKELFVMDYDGANVVRFAEGKTMAAPCFNRSGTQIAYTAYRPVYPDVLVMAFPSGGRHAVACFPGLNSGASFSPNGSKIALTLSKDGNPEIYTMSADGGAPRRLTRSRGGKSSPTWSPDGSQIAFASDEGGRPQIYVMPSSGGATVKLTSSPAYNTEPNWSAATDKNPSGLIACSSLSGGNWAISTVDPKGGGSRVIYSNGSCEDPSWAADARHIVFSKKDGGQANLYVLDIIKGEAVQLSRDFGNCTEPTWSGR